MNANTIVTFIIGAGVGSVATWFYTSKKYERIAQEEIDSVKEVFLKRTKDHGVESDPIDKNNESIKEEPHETPNETPNETPWPETVRKYNETVNNIISKQNYTQYSDKDGENEMMKHTRPYVLSPKEFDDPEYDHYEKISLNYYSDLILTNENNDIIENVEDLIGFESLSTFGRYEDDSVFVRNDTLECDFEILLDQRTYSESVPKKIRKQHEVD